MKICELCAVDFTLAQFLLPLMTALRARGHEVVGACGPGPLVARATDAGFTVTPIPVSRSYDLAAHWRSLGEMTAFFRAERFDVVHVHTPVAGLIGRLAAWRAGVPHVVYTAHGFYFHDRMGRIARTVFTALEWLAGRRTDLLLAVSSEDAATAQHLGLCRGRVEAVGNGVDPARFRPLSPDRRSTVRAALDTPDDAIVVATTARLTPEKGIPELLAAMSNTRAFLWLIGPTLESERSGIGEALDAARRDPDRRDRIRLLGYRDDVPDLLGAADIFALPSHREGLPVSVIEAMMAGLPVVATRIRGCRELVVEDETGLLVEVGDAAALTSALERLARDAEMRRRFGAAGRARAEARHDLSAVLSRQVTLIESLAGAEGR